MNNLINFLQPLSHVIVKFYLEGKTYDVERFKIGFTQPIDYKGQPQHEVRGGLISITIDQMPDAGLTNWARKSTQLKNGSIVFHTLMSNPVMRVEFEDAYCITLTRVIDARKGTRTALVISPETVKVNDVEHYNDWPR